MDNTSGCLQKKVGCNAVVSAPGGYWGFTWGVLGVFLGPQTGCKKQYRMQSFRVPWSPFIKIVRVPMSSLESL